MVFDLFLVRIFSFCYQKRMPTLRRSSFFKIDNPLFPFRCLKVISHLIFVLQKHSLSLDSPLHHSLMEIGKTAIRKWVKWRICVSNTWHVMTRACCQKIKRFRIWLTFLMFRYYIHKKDQPDWYEIYFSNNLEVSCPCTMFYLDESTYPDLIFYCNTVHLE